VRDVAFAMAGAWFGEFLVLGTVAVILMCAALPTGIPLRRTLITLGEFLAGITVTTPFDSSSLTLATLAWYALVGATLTPPRQPTRATRRPRSTFNPPNWPLYGL